MAIHHRAIIEHIDQSVEVVRQLFADNFALTLKADHWMGPKSKALFNNIWQVLDQRQKQFSCIEELDHFYKRIANNLEQCIAISCNSSEVLLNRAKLTIDDIQLIDRLVNVCHELMRQRYLLNLFQEDDLPDSLDAIVRQLEEACDLIEPVMLARKAELNILNESLESTMREIMNVIKSKGYGLRDFHFDNGVMRDDDSIFFQEAKCELQKLWPAADVNQVTSLINNAHSQRERKILRDRVADYATLFEGIRNELAIIMTRLFHSRDQAFSFYVSEIQEIDIQLECVRSLQSQANAANFTAKLKEQHLKKQPFNAPKQLSSLLSYIPGAQLLGFKKDEFNAELQRCLSPIQVEISQFAAGYDSVIVMYNKLAVRISRYKTDKIELDALLNKLKEGLQRAREYWGLCAQAMTDSLGVLHGHVKSNLTPKEYVSLFFSDHWWKLLLGGLGGGGVSTLVTMLLALEPTKIGLLAAAGLIGGAGLGAGTGLLIDHGCHSRVDLAQDVGSESQALLSSHHDSIWSKPTFADTTDINSSLGYVRR